MTDDERLDGCGAGVAAVSAAQEGGRMSDERAALVARLREAEQCFKNLSNNPSDGMMERAEAVHCAIAALTAPSEREAVRVLEEVRREMQEWRECNAREGVWTADQMLGHVLVWLDAKLAALRAEATQEDTP